MKISVGWLRELVALPAGVTWQEIVRRLSLSGTAVDAVEQVGAGLSGIVVAEIRGRRPHPRADKLTLVDVFDGQTVTQVVCGAPNVPTVDAAGEPGRSPRVAWARPGATLPGGLTLSAKEVRGVLSPGMLCAEDELGLSPDHAGILLLTPEDGLPVGADFAAAAGLPDVVLELDVTPNRPDCLGHVGVAREVAALFREEGARLVLPQPDLRAHFGAPAGVTVEIADAAACPRYTARVLRGLRVRPSPLPLRLRLQRLGVRALSNLVDATNLTLLEWGQPLHAFDLAHVRGRRIVVRRARPGETLTTLDGAVRELVPGDLLIADAERGLALAGVMGGQESEVAADTRDVLLESAYFDPVTIRRTARRLKLHTEASHRFERGVDPEGGVVGASERCAQLLLELGGGQVSPDLVDAYPRPMAPRKVALRPARTEMLLGTPAPAAEQAQVLAALGMQVTPAPAPAEGVLQVTVPTWRPDLTREVDLIEEVGRLRGIDRVEPRLPPQRLLSRRPDPGALAFAVADRARDLCCALGLDEIQTFSFVGPERLQQLGFAADDRRARPLVLVNPLREELSAMRTQLVVGLLEALRHNYSHGLRDIGLFEVAEVYLPRHPPAGPADGAPEEHARVAGVLAGARDHAFKARPEDELDFLDVRGIVDELVAGLGLGPLSIRAARSGEVPWLHPGVAAVLERDGRVLGELGEIHPDLRQRLSIEARAFAFELHLPETLPPLPRFVPLPRYPEVTRDLSFFVEDTVPASEFLGALRAAGEPLLVGVQVLEDYREPGKVPAGKKGILLSLVYRSAERTLTDEEVQQAHGRVVGHLQQRIVVDLR